MGTRGVTSRYLLGDGVAVDAPAAAGRLGDGDRTILADLRDRKPDAVDVGYVLQAGLPEVPAGRPDPGPGVGFEEAP